MAPLVDVERTVLLRPCCSGPDPSLDLDPGTGLDSIQAFELRVMKPVWTLLGVRTPILGWVLAWIWNLFLVRILGSHQGPNCQKPTREA